LEATDAVAEAGLEGGRDMIGERRRSLGKRDEREKVLDGKRCREGRGCGLNGVQSDES
jgi:hypothetical protein